MRVPFDKITDPVSFLVNTKFALVGLHGNVNEPKDAFDFENISKDLQQAVEKYIAELNAMTEDEIEHQVTITRLILGGRKVGDFAANELCIFYHQPYCAADYKLWLNMAFWNLDEMVSLSLGKDPNFVTWENVKQYVGSSPFAKAYRDKREIISRSITVGQLSEQTNPTDFLAWAKRMNIEVPYGLTSTADELGLQIVDWKVLHDLKNEFANELLKKIEKYSELQKQPDTKLETNAKSKELNPRERESMLKLIIGMAIKKYHHNVLKAKNTSTANIATDLIQLGIHLDEDTIRKYLNEAKGLLNQN